MEERGKNSRKSENLSRKYKGKGKGVGKGQSNRHLQVSCSRDNISVGKTSHVEKQKCTQGTSMANPKSNERVINTVISSEPVNPEMKFTGTTNKEAHSNKSTREDPLMADLLWTRVEPNDERIPRLVC